LTLRLVERRDWIVPQRPSAPLPGNPARLILHESGPVVEIQAGRIEGAKVVLEVVRDLARAWAARDTGPHQGEPWVDVRLGDTGDDPWPRGLRRFTTDPLTLAAELNSEGVDLCTEYADALTAGPFQGQRQRSVTRST
jgi:hypothetical protein